MFWSMFEVVNQSVLNNVLLKRDARFLFQDKTMNPSDALVELGARVCYRSVENMGKVPDFVTRCMQKGHYDVAEHGHAVARVSTHLPFWEKQKYLNCFSFDGTMYASGNLRAWFDVLQKIDFLPLKQQMMEELNLVSPKIFPIESPIVAKEVDSIASLPFEPVPSFSENVQLLGTDKYIYQDPEMALLLNQATFYFTEVSRSMTHQLVRHRTGSFCLAFDTVVPAFRSKRGNLSKRWTMQQLWQWQNDPKRKGRIRLMRLRGMNEKGELIPVHIKQVIDCGIQPVYSVTTESGRKIKATMNHLFSTPNGWKKLSSISIGDLVWANGVPAYKNEEYLRQRYLVENTERKTLAAELGVSDATLGKWLARFGLQKPKSQYCNRHPGHGKKGMFSNEAKSAISARMKGSNNPHWKGDNVGISGARLRTNKMYTADLCSRCSSTHRLQRHHRDTNPKNNTPENIIILCEPCHKAEHFGQAVMTVFRDKVVSIEFVGNEQTYDLEIDHECHNFVANGFVVHNSQESQRYVDLEKGDWKYIVPPSIAASTKTEAIYKSVIDAIELGYKALRKEGITKEDARYLLPNATTTRIVVSAPFYAWKHFLDQRTARDAQWEIRHVACEVRETLNTIAPHVFKV